MNALHRMWALTKKELLAVLKDKVARMSLLVPPMVQAFIFGYAATYDLNHVQYAVLDQDNSSTSRALLAKLDGSDLFERIGDLRSEAEIRSYIDAGRALVVLQINQDFERRLLAGQAADVQLIADGRNSNTAGTAIGYINNIVESFNTEWRAARGRHDASLSMVTRAWYNPNLETRWKHDSQHDRHADAIADADFDRHVGWRVNANKGLSINCWSHRSDRLRSWWARPCHRF